MISDTEGSVLPARVGEIAQATVEYLASLAQVDDQVAALENFTVDSILSGIEYYRVHDHIEQVALVMQLPALVEEHNRAHPDNPVGLIVIDSIAFHFRTHTGMCWSQHVLPSPHPSLCVS